MVHSTSDNDGAPQAVADCHKDDIAREQVRLLYAQLPPGQLITLLNASIVVYVISRSHDPMLALTWFAVVAGLVVYRLALSVAFRFSNPDRGHTKRWLMAFNSGVLAIGLTWGAAGLWATLTTDPATHMLIGFVLGGMAAGGLSTLAVKFRTYLLFLIPALVPFAAGLFLTQNELEFGMGVMATLFVLGLYTSGKRYSQVLLDSLSLRYQNIGLIEDLREAVDKVEHASAEKSRFLASVSHEIRTPMNGVLGMSNLLKKTTLSDRQRRIVNTIHQSANSLLAIINDTLDICRIEAGKYTLDSSKFDLGACVEDATVLLAEQAASKGIELTLLIANSVPKMAIGDPVRIRQICVNLIGNALKFTERGDVRVRLEAEQTGDGPRINVKLSIEDTGIGMNKDTLKRIEAPYVQADSSIGRRFGGTGLGLAITKQIVDLMGGAIVFDSQLGVGTRVEACFELQTAGEDSKPAAKLAGERLLLVCAHQGSRDVLQAYLKDAGADVRCVKDGTQAQQELKQAAGEETAYTMMICDHDEARLDAIALTQHVKSEPTTADVSVLMTTPFGWDDNVGTAIESGIAEILPKPVLRRELLQAVLQQLAPIQLWPCEDDDIESQQHMRQFSGHVLVVEDNPVNWEVAKEYLESFGCSAELACDGCEGLEKAASGGFDLILMDVQMPKMDGFTATQEIRQMERKQGSAKTPIIALTANPLESERQACLDVGMNGCVGKPFSEEDLEEVLASWLVPKRHAPQRQSLEGNALSKFVDRQPELAKRIVELFLDYATKIFSNFETALETKDFEALAQTAHSLKSSSGNVGAHRLAELCEELERVSARKKMPEVSGHVLQIVLEYERVQRELSDAVAGLATRPTKQARDRTA